MLGNPGGPALGGEDDAQGARFTSEAEAAESVASSRVLLWARVAEASTPCTKVDLWYSADRARTWRLWKQGNRVADVAKPKPHSDAPLNPITFDAEQDGLYGFYLVMWNVAGASAPPPQPGTAPQKWVRVDRSTPIVQLLTYRADDHFEINREIHIRWTVQDDNLPNRPVKLHCRSEQTRTYQLLADLQAVEGSYRWTVPEDLTGRIEVKCSATDRAGNTGRYVADWLSIDPVTRQAKRNDTKTLEPKGLRIGGATRSNPQGLASLDPREDVPALLGRLHGNPPAAVRIPDPKEAKRARKLYDLGTWHRLRGEYAVAIERFREALRLEPGLLEARNDLGGLLFLQGRHDEAEAEFRHVLAEDPAHQAALKCLALVQASRRNYSSSHETLRKLLRLNPEDAEAWLYMGDVAMFMGDRQPAREAWGKASALDTASEEVKERATKRLAIYKPRT